MPRKATPTGLKVNVKKLRDDAIIPQYHTEDAACFDLYCLDDIHLRSLNGEPKALKVHTGLAFEIPKGYHMKIFLRSSIGLNTHLRLANQTGIIDADYRGEVVLLCENVSRYPLNIPKGTRIAQGMIEKNEPVVFNEVKELGKTKRNTGGLGSTGKE